MLRPTNVCDISTAVNFLYWGKNSKCYGLLIGVTLGTIEIPRNKIKCEPSFKGSRIKRCLPFPELKFAVELVTLSEERRERMTSEWLICNFCLSFVIFLILMTKDRQTWHFNDKSQSKVRNFGLFVWLSGLKVVTVRSEIKSGKRTNLFVSLSMSQF